jgi:hypothetical protein
MCEQIPREYIIMCPFLTVPLSYIRFDSLAQTRMRKLLLFISHVTCTSIQEACRRTGVKYWFKLTKQNPNGKLLPLQYRNQFSMKQVTCVEYEGISDDSEREIFQVSRLLNSPSVMCMLKDGQYSVCNSELR